MSSISIPKKHLSKLLDDMETLVSDMEILFDQDEVARERLFEIKADSSIGRSEEELDAYLKKKGVSID